MARTTDRIVKVVDRAAKDVDRTVKIVDSPQIEGKKSQGDG